MYRAPSMEEMVRLDHRHHAEQLTTCLHQPCTSDLYCACLPEPGTPRSVQLIVVLGDG